ncbi:NAD(P)-dependent oxidoreductase [bacterium LRH843]|nr:NAD(P)-dependent oxidoreductase [bacterium LRH843]
MKRALVTGGLGFIGFHLCQRLILEGVEVVCIDEMPDAKKAEQEEMAMRLGRNSLLTMINDNVENVKLTDCLKDVDVIYHLAASTSADSKWPKLSAVIENNVNLTRKIVEAIPKKARFIFSSTVEVYGERPGVITERTPTNPTSPYGITKLASESLIKKACQEKEISYVILRLPTVYGPWQREDMTYQQLITGMTNPARDRSTLDVLFVEDVVDAFLLAATTKKVNEVFHLSTGSEGAWYEGIGLLAQEELPFMRSPIKASLSNEKSEKLLGFRAKTNLKEGLAKQSEHMAQWLKQKNWFD